MANRKPTTQAQHDEAHISFRLPTKHLDALRAKAREEDRSLSAEFRRAVVAHLEKEAA